ncbi:MAG TPA: glutathione S-transferase family protein [Stellaceae bacterium]|jgi:glutathione S-transferase|nr:glutathione S-transferase family protein [Stellaceae bacterium]
MLELYHHGTSVCAAKARIVLAEKGLDWVSRYVDILKGEQFAPGYLKLNPKHVVPTLVHDGQVIRESTLIGEYIDDVFPDPPLKPAAALDRVTMRMWTKRLDEELHPATGIVTYAISHRHAVIANGPEAIKAWVENAPPAEHPRRRQRLEAGIEHPDATACMRIYDRFLGDMEAQLAQTRWLAGERFSLAEVGVIPYINRLDMLALSDLWTEKRPHLTDWWQRVKARPTFEPALFKYVPPGLGEMMAKYGRESWPTVKAIVQQGG